MLRIRSFLSAAVILIGLAIVSAPVPALADPIGVRVYDDGILQGGISVFSVGNSLIYFGTTTHFSLTNGSGLSNNPGSPGGSNLDLSANQQVNATFGSTGGTHTIRIELSQTGYMLPITPDMWLTSSAGGSFAYAGSTGATESVTAKYQGFLDTTNTLFGQPGGSLTPLQTASASATAPGTISLVFSPGTSASLVTGSTPFSITDVLEFTFTLGAGSGQASANVSASTVASAVPEPNSLALILAGVPLALSLYRRRQVSSR